MPLLIKLRLASIAFAMRYFSTPLFYVAFLRCAIASPVNSLPCRCDSLLLHALPLRHVSRPCHSHAIISNSELCRCGANHIVSMQFHCVSVQSFALPLMRGSNPQLAIASPFIEKLCHCDQFRISYENFPRPLLRTVRCHAEHRNPATHARPSRENRPEERFQTRRSNQRNLLAVGKLTRSPCAVCARSGRWHSVISPFT